PDPAGALAVLDRDLRSASHHRQPDHHGRPRISDPLPAHAAVATAGIRRHRHGRTYRPAAAELQPAVPVSGVLYHLSRAGPAAGPDADDDGDTANPDLPTLEVAADHRRLRDLHERIWRTLPGKHLAR